MNVDALAAAGNSVRIHAVPAVIHQRVELSAPPYELWLRGTLLTELGGWSGRAEIIGGELVISRDSFANPATIEEEMCGIWSREDLADGDYRWSRTGEVCPSVAANMLPASVLVDAELYRDLGRADANYLIPRQAVDRSVRSGTSSWTGYALVNIPCYLLEGQVLHHFAAVLYTGHARGAAVVRVLREWRFGETIALPEPFGIEIPTDEWEAWDES